MTKAEVERRKTSHRKPYNMSFLFGDVVEYGQDVIRRASLRIRRRALRNIGRGKTARIECDHTVSFPEMT
jgi:hypothetical protein